MRIAIFKESQDDRVALVPEIVKRLEQEKNEVLVEEGAGEAAYHPDWQYQEVNGRIESRDIIFKEGELFVTLHPLENGDWKKFSKGAVIVSLFEPYAHPEIVEKLAQYAVTVFSMDIIPRVTIAQTMDVLSSMQSTAGYLAVIEAARHLPRYFPMITSAAGTIPPAKVLILGAGVAGLQAVATAKRLGGVVEVFDTRAAVKEQVESLGAKFVEVEGALDDVKAKGYAVEQTEEYKKRQVAKIHEKAIASDVIITTAQLRGKPAPLLLTKDMVNEMKLGSVIIDLAASTGGNCELTENGKVVKKYGVIIIGNSNLAADMPMHASQLFSRNVYNFLKLLVKEGELNLDWENEIIKSSCLVHQGKVMYNQA
ncbi:MAG: Re/Si-specific NAD(P)(+) transhydrogenase subunit alpha [Bacteroidetes bacterium]|nr:Re/Si-specific NAD(P)(+) transhydrogenase subunit alpha [Bacteroidota bacterium]